MPRGINRTDLNKTGTSYRNGTPITLPHEFGNVIDLTTKNFGNVVNWTPDPAHFGNDVDWTPSPDHFGNIIGSSDTPQFESIDITLSAADLTALNDGPMTVVAGRPGMIPLVESGFFVIYPGDTPYGSTPVNLFIGSGATSGPTSLENYTGLATILQQSVASIAFFNPGYMFGTNDSPTIPNIALSDLTGSGIYFGLGSGSVVDGNGTARLFVEYTFVEA